MDRLREVMIPSHAGRNPAAVPHPPARNSPPSKDPRRYLPIEATAEEHWEAGFLLGSIGRYQEAALEFMEASKKDPGLTSVEFTFQGYQFRFNDCPGSQEAAYILYEIENLYKIEKLGLKPGDVIVDIGAHVGFVSIIAAKLYPGVRIYSYEPSKGRFPVLLQNIRENGVEGHITAVNKGVAGKTGTLDFCVAPNNIVVSGQYYVPELNHMVRSDEWGHDRIDCVSLDELFTEHGIDECRWMKIDCEGAEYEILLNATVLQRVREIGMELHVPPSSMVGIDHVMRWLVGELERRNGRLSMGLHVIGCEGPPWTDLVMGLMNDKKAMAA